MVILSLKLISKLLSTFMCHSNASKRVCISSQYFNAMNCAKESIRDKDTQMKQSEYLENNGFFNQPFFPHLL